MAKGEATLLLRVKAFGTKVFKALGKALTSLGKTTTKVGATFLAVYAAMSAAIIKFGSDGSKFKQVQDAFRALAASQGVDADKMLKKIQELSGGTVTNMEIMKQANTAALLGLPVEKFGEMVKIARGAAAATGQSMQFMLNSIVTGIGRGSKLMLDNLGIIINTEKAYEKYANSLGRAAASLTDTEKKQAFMNEAIRIGTANLQKQGGVTQSSADSWTALMVTMKNIKDRLTVLVIPALKELVRATAPMIKTFDELSSHPFVTTFAKVVTKGFAMMGVMIDVVVAILKEKLMPIVDALPAFFAGNFAKVRKILTRETKTMSDVLIEQRKVLVGRFAKIDEDFLALTDQNLEKEAVLRRAAAQRKAQELIVASENATIKQMEDAVLEQQLEALSEEKLLEIQLRAINTKLQNTQDFNVKKRLLNAKAAKVEQITELKAKKAKEKSDKEDDDRELSNRRSTLARIASLASSGNSTLAAIGKAAALTSIAIETPKAVMQAMASGIPYPLNLIAAASVAAMGAAQAAQVTGIKLAEGGIVSARSGGTHAIIGEAGKDELVLPLDDDSTADRLGGLGGHTFIFQGAMMGDETQARQFAEAVDKELFSLRQAGSSIAFDDEVQ